MRAAVCDRARKRVSIGDRHGKAGLSHQWQVWFVVAQTRALACLNAKAREQSLQYRRFVRHALMYVLDAQFLATARDCG
jgi:hypothetical protein